MPRSNTKRPPFNKDLNGWQRIRRDQARLAWSWGLPVYQDAGKGAVLLDAHGEAQAPKLREPDSFDKACARAIGDGRPFTKSIRDRCIYLIPHGTMTLHFTFTDGSNPFVKYATWQELVYELQAWSHTHRLTPLGSHASRCAAYSLADKRSPGNDLFVTP